MATAITISEVSLDDSDSLSRHVEFEDAHGRARFDVDGLRAWVPTVKAALILAAEDEQRRLVGCATASVVAELQDSVQINGFCLPGRPEVLRALADRIEIWEGPANATTLLAHVSDPPPEQEEIWGQSGFVLSGTRARVELVPSLEGLPQVELPEGVQIVSLAQHPDHALDALRVWNECHLDIPTVLPFKEQTLEEWRLELGIIDGDDYPESFLIAVANGKEVAGVAYLNVDEENSIAGHRFTGTSQDWRGKGLATALKIAQIRWAAQSGISLLRASNDSLNAPMRAVNDRLGYKEAFRIVMFQRDITN